jgi:large subunit ribosomal protein L11
VHKNFKYKKIKGIVRIQVKSGEANPAPPVGPVLGSRGVNLMDFCKKFNLETSKEGSLDKGTVVTVVVTIYEDKTFDFVVKSPPTSYLIKKYIKSEKGCQQPKKQPLLYITAEDIEVIAKIKSKDLTAITLSSAIKTVQGTVFSMGFGVR